MSVQNPLEIPELIGLVGTYLAGNDLARCAQVSKRWRDLFLPHRWRVVSVGSRIPLYPPVYTGFGPHSDDIYQHRHLIHDLSLVGLPGIAKFKYPVLRKLTIDDREASRYNYSRQDIFLELTEMFPLVVDLNIMFIKLSSPSWLTLSAHQHLTKLRHMDLWYRRSNVLGSVQEAEKPQSAPRYHRRWGHPISNGIRPSPLPVNGMTSLGIRGQLDLILRCPNLEDVEWIGTRFLGHLNNVVHVLKSGYIPPKQRWPPLNMLTIHQGFRRQM